MPNERVTPGRVAIPKEPIAPRPLPGEPRPPWPTRLVAALIAFAVFAGAAVFVWRTFAPDGAPLEEPTVELSPGGAFDDIPVGWTDLPAPPEVRTGAATAWTGTELLVWGGFTGFDEHAVSVEGLVFNAISRTWSVLPSGPLAARTLAASAWTGTELLVWGGWNGVSGPEFAEDFFDDGAAYDPGSGTWRPLPRAPIDARAPLSVWTGRELLVWGTSLRVEDRPRDGAAYDPATDTWRVIPEAPIELTDATAVWTGQEMIVFGAALHGGNAPESETAIGAAYDPVADTWRRIPDSTLLPQASTAAWSGGEMIAWDYLNDSAAYDPTTDAWRSLPRVPLDDAECSPQSAAVGGHVLGDYCGVLAMFDPLEQRWVWLDLPERSGPPFWDFELIPATSVFLLPAQRYGETGETRFFAFRPGRAADTTGATPAKPTPFIPGEWVEGDVSHVPVTFPDGSSATLTYPAELDLASMGLQPDVSYVWRDDPPPRFPILFLHGPEGVEAAFLDGAGPRATYPAGGAEVTLWAAAGTEFTADRDIRWWLVYRTPAWSVLVSLRDDSDAQIVASSLSIQETDTGLPVVHASGPVELAEGFGESEGTTLTIADAIPEPNAVSDLLNGTVFLSPDGCSGGPEHEGRGYASNCLGDGNVFASIYGDEEFVAAVLQGLRVESFSPTPA